MTYRLLHPCLAAVFHPDEYEVRPERGVVNERSCLIMTNQVKGRGQERSSYWIDASRDFSILRYIGSVDGHVRVQLDVEYSQSGQTDWVPSNWILVRTASDGSLKESSVSKVVRFDINPSIDSEQFRLDFPPGTRVRDETSTSTPDYIMKDAGNKRVIRPEEIGSTYDELAATDPDRGNYQGMRVIRWVLMGIVLCGLLLFVMRKKWRQLR